MKHAKRPRKYLTGGKPYRYSQDIKNLLDLLDLIDRMKTVFAELAPELSMIDGGVLPDGDGVTTPVGLWAESWLGRIEMLLEELEEA